ncbi:GTP pyrophosphokinase [Pelagicoccus sp. NFK12]|uniref:GTP pyrophosphokinase n=1 Tax=Pelagicoccus enzymogenes TaxID=2773457 RepID=A0A927F7X2_9BACT|nr:GTP pyrophosphokinase [Pelagicoccus enzymogenes]MBD5779917.1 GTP pyrophosphokinase [Pelagicoccus enzymogenes]
MDPNIVVAAQRIATQAHDGQYRRNGQVPYIEHPRAVASRVGEDVEAQVVAWLHDVLEDCDVSKEQLQEAGIPEQCIAAVELLSKTPGEDYDAYLERVAANPLASKVKIADMISNLADHPTNKQLKKYAKGLTRLTRDL